MLDISALTQAASQGPRSILRVVQVLDRLAACPQGESLSQLCNSLGLPKTTVFTMLKVLESAGYLTSHAGTFRLGPAAAALGAAMVQSPKRNFPECARGVLNDLVRRTGETCFLAVLTPDRRACQYVAAVEADNWLRFSVKVGSLKPAFATGSGRAMWAWLPPSELRQLLETTSFDRLTPKTVSSRRALHTSLKEVRKRGVSVVDSGTVDGVIAIAAPIFGSDGEVVAAASVGGPISRVGPRQREIEQAALTAAGEISGVLGFRGDWPPTR